ncbi:hypothetical protein ACFRKB_19040 [Streptomyces scopuliridis]|uniref:hypothetical protein n=1 Tax=Streptomyces scopuliridis TaxID=452529 RepID=UPI00369B7FE0
MMSPTRDVPQVLVQIDDCLARVAAERGGALWRLAEAGRQLDATVVRLPPGAAAVEEHAEPDLDVLLLVSYCSRCGEALPSRASCTYE